jgi:hypothetical protein
MKCSPRVNWLGARFQSAGCARSCALGFGFCGDEYEDIIRQLNDSGKATVVL